MRFFAQLNHPKSTVNITLAASIYLLLLLLSGCEGCHKIVEEQSEKPRFVIVLVDETESFALYKKGKITKMFWPEVIPCVANIVEHLQPGEKFCLIGVDEHGFDTDDVRINIRTLDRNILKAVQEKRKIKPEVRELTRRQERHRMTDVLGALYHAAHFLSKQSSHRGVVAIFSDMIQEPRLPTLQDASDLKFPQGTRIYCFYVNATGRDRWDRIVNAWVPVLKSAGLEVTEDNFYQRAEKGQISKIFSTH